MAKKRRKKRVQPTNSKKQEWRHFQSQLRHFFEACGDPEAFDLLTPNQHTYLFNVRFRTLQVLFDKAEDWPSQMKSWVRGLLKRLLACRSISFKSSSGVEGKPMGLLEFFIVGESVGTLLLNKSDDDEKSIREDLRVRMKDFWKQYQEGIAFIKTVEICYALFFLTNKLGHGYIHYTHDFHFGALDALESGRFELMGNALNYKCVNAVYHSPESEKILINGIVRVGFRVANDCRYQDFSYLSFSSRQLNGKQKGENSNYDVFIQYHAIARFRERCDDVIEPLLNTYLHESLWTCKCQKRGDNYWIDVIVRDRRIGYFVGSIVDDKFLIRTFLLVTCGSTVEGQRLQKLLGCVKEDIHYMKLDRLSSFVNGDLQKNKELVEVLKQVGLDYLLEFSYNDFYVKQDREIKKIAKSISDYLNCDVEVYEDLYIEESVLRDA